MATPAEQEQEQEQLAVVAAVDALLRDPDSMVDDSPDPALAFSESHRVKLEDDTSPRTPSSRPPHHPPHNRLLSYTTLPHPDFGDEGPTAGKAAGRVSPPPPHPYRYQRAPLYSVDAYEQLLAQRTGSESGLEGHALDSKGKNKSAREPQGKTTRELSHDERAELVVEWERAVALRDADQQANEAAADGFDAQPKRAAFPCDVARLKGLKVDGRVPARLLVKRLRARRGVSPKEEGDGVVKLEEASPAGKAVATNGEALSRPGIQPTGHPYPSWYSNKSYSDSRSGSGSGSDSRSGFASTSGSGDTAPTFSPTTPLYGFSYGDADPYFNMDMAANPYDLDAGLYGVDPFHGSAYAYEQSPGGQLAALEAARSGGLTTLGIAPSAAFGGMGMGYGVGGDAAYGLGLSPGAEASWNAQPWAGGDTKGKGKAQEVAPPTMPTMAAMAAQVQIINQAALADIERLHGHAIAPEAVKVEPPVQPAQQMPFIEYQPGPAGGSGTGQKRRRESVRAAPTPVAAATTSKATDKAAASSPEAEAKPAVPPASANTTATNSKKRKSEVLSQTQASTVRANVKTTTETELEIQKRRREGNAAAAKKCRENQKAKYELLAREKASLAERLQEAEATNLKLMAHVQRLQCENTMLKKEKFAEFTKESMTKMANA